MIDILLLVLRVWLGVVMFAHGINHIFGGGKIAGTGRWFTSIGMRNGRMQAWIASVTELAGGTLLVLGLFTPLAAAALVGVMTVAIVTVHVRNGFFIIKEGYEYAVTLILLAIFVAASDSTYGLDSVIRLSIPSGFAAVIAAAGAVVAILQLAVFWRPSR